MIHQIIWPSPGTLVAFWKNSHSERGYLDSARLLGESWWSKKWGAIRGKKFHGNREILVEWTVGVVGAQGQLTQGAIMRNPRIKYKRSENIFSVTSIALIIGRDWPRLVHLLVQSLIGSPSTLVLVPSSERGYRDSARLLLGELCADKKWGATSEKNYS